MNVRLLNAGDGAVTVEFGAVLSPALVARVAALEQALDAARAAAAPADGLPGAPGSNFANALGGVIETVPTFRSLTVLYDPLRTSRAELDPLLHALLAPGPAPQATPARRWRLPVCYGGDYGADLPAVAAARGLTPDEVVRLHSGAQFTIYMLGFMPGFPFMGGLPDALAMPRRQEPRLRVPAGSVAITTGLSAIYPWQSPGGWQLLGRCPVPLFDATAAQPVLLAPGDQVCFEAVSASRLATLDAGLRSGAVLASSFLEQP